MSRFTPEYWKEIDGLNELITLTAPSNHLTPVRINTILEAITAIGQKKGMLQVSAGSPLTVEILNKIEWDYIALGSLKEIFKKQYEAISEYHRKMFVLDMLWAQFNEAVGDKQRISVIQDAIRALKISNNMESSELEKINKEELKNFLLKSLTSYCQEILPEIKKVFSNPKLLPKNTVFTATVELEEKGRFFSNK